MTNMIVTIQCRHEYLFIVDFINQFNSYPGNQMNPVVLAT